VTLDDLITAAVGELKVDVVKRLTGGGQKAVVQVKSANGEMAALKVVQLAGPYAADAKERAKREVELLLTVTSPQVVRALSPIVEIGNPPKGVAWLEEFLEGKDLGEALVTPWDWPDARTMLGDVARGLAAFHERKVVHRDLSPGNVRRLPNGRYKLIDPGLARHLAKATMTGTFQPGTPGFMSPEHVTPGARPTPSSDVFSAGILAYVALTTSLPYLFDGDFEAYAMRLRNGNYSRLETVRPGLLAEAYDVIGRCLQRHPARRYLDGGELLIAVGN